MIEYYDDPEFLKHISAEYEGYSSLFLITNKPLMKKKLMPFRSVWQLSSKDKLLIDGVTCTILKIENQVREGSTRLFLRGEFPPHATVLEFFVYLLNTDMVQIIIEV